ncbi:MAG: prolyl-tRNA synthetase associated domain-containing protein [Bacteroidales bacterium]|nr:prolyl-tRNA synthetase associated domain-containing protein [Bacteroidales bacterium]MDT8430365.1 prolyl-tRNA synthetase associated domain-containing protein [Bacteroidales bacterium]
MTQQEKVLGMLDQLDIAYEVHEHRPLPTIEIAMEVWKDIDSTHCKNLFFRNHKGNRHYLVILESNHQLDIHDLEKRLKQGKISFASPKRLDKYLGLHAGSVSPFGLINDTENHVHVFLDKQLLEAEKISFHPNVNTASVVIDFGDFQKYLDRVGNSYEFLELY